MTRRRKRTLAAGLAVLLLLLTGCQGQPTLNRRLLIRGIGVDLLEDESCRVTIHALDASDAEEDRVELFTSEGETVLDALNNVTAQTGKTPLYSQNLLVLFGRRCVEQGLDGVLDFFVRYSETRPTVPVFLSDTTAEEILRVEKGEGYVLTQDLAALSQSGDLNAKAVRVRVLDLINQRAAGGSAYLPILQAGEGEVRHCGTAVLRNGVLAGELNAEQTRGLLFLTKQITWGTEVLDAGETGGAGRVTVTFFRSGCEIEPAFSEGTPSFRIRVGYAANLSSADGGGKPLGEEYYGLFERALERKLQRQVEDVLQTCLQELQCDVFRFGRRLQQADPEAWRAIEEDWPEQMAQAACTVEAEVEIRRVGQELTPDIGR